MQLAELLADSGDPAAARAICVRAIRLYPLYATIANYRLGVIAAELGEHREAARLFELVREDWPSNRIVAYQLASVLAHLKRFDEANAIFASGIAVTCGDASKTTSAVIRFPHRQLATQRPIPFDRTVCLNAADPNGPVGDGVDAIYFVACDCRYFELFAEPLAVSLASNSSINWLLHVHLMNSTPGAVAALGRLQRQNRPRVRWSSERVHLDHLTERQRRTYYACSRYLVLPDILRRYRRPMVVADIDQVVVRDPGSLLADMARCDLGLLRFPRQASNFLALISASVILLNPTPGAERFCERVRDILVERMTQQEAIAWHLDQAALGVAYLISDDVRIQSLPPSIMDSTIANDTVAPPAPDAFFWSVTFSDQRNRSKLGSKWFRQFLADEG
jgi:hypothetical protein